MNLINWKLYVKKNEMSDYGTKIGAVLAVNFKHVGDNYFQDTTFACGLAYYDGDFGNTDWNWSVTLFKKPELHGDYESNSDCLESINNITTLKDMLDNARKYGLNEEDFVHLIEQYIDKAIIQAGGINNLTIIAATHADLARLGQLLVRPIDYLLHWKERKIPMVTTDFFYGFLHNVKDRPSKLEDLIWDGLKHAVGVTLPEYNYDPKNNAMKTAMVYWHLTNEIELTSNNIEGQTVEIVPTVPTNPTWAELNMGNTGIGTITNTTEFITTIPMNPTEWANYLQWVMAPNVIDN